VNKLKILLLIVFLPGPFFCSAQQLKIPSTKGTLDEITKNNASSDHRTFAFKKDQGVIGIIFSSLFYGYKAFLSSQDRPTRCAFTPSCSEYGLLAVRKYGVVPGMIRSFDRLSRCNNFVERAGYTEDEKTGFFIDHP
jgi:putative component of membrane protein insertase Oxa1/YidC/SpoIIIJ protein YidD